ncbi:proton-conducting transporter membrane subunit [Ferrimonas balearica]|uniref:proton-conducting transporter transmembrane domain-containing protein n=1 Tax=Ferrimonas balearica TaxID=44012 RepID=UPI001C9A038C|nr:proton-conducting transporter membrane subunit [Ferrimonas balearica]MBY5920772.1 monovalent cation/H+ antiporter subunit D family protein [Ferrimonas balearica]MBY5996543.1 monovalent cation/H+ antiporter subunit D family protein [Ferrimonas balearica]
MMAVLLIPWLVALGVVYTGRHPNLREAISLIGGVILFAQVYQLYQMPPEPMILPSPFPGLSVGFSVEPLGLLFALVASALWPVTALYAIGYMRSHGEANQTRFFACFALAMGAVMGIAFARDLLTLFFFYEVLTLSTYPLVTHAGTPAARQGGRVYLGVLLFTSIVLLLLAMIGVQREAGTLVFAPGGVFSEPQDPMLLSVLLLLFVLGVGKAAMVPFHRWLPAAMVAPTPVSALLHAVAVVKAGVFTILKGVVYLFGLETVSALPVTPMLLGLAAFSIIWASLVAMRQDNLKKRLAYSTVSQLGYITAAAMLATPLGIMAGGMQIAAHALGKITLFFCAGAILVASHKTNVSQLDGIGRRMPWTMAAFFLASLSIIGLPPTGGAWSKWLLLSASLDRSQWLLVGVLVLSTLLNVAYLLPIPVRAFLRQAPEEESHTGEAPWPVLLALLLTAFATLVLFWVPETLAELGRLAGGGE